MEAGWVKYSARSFARFSSGYIRSSRSLDAESLPEEGGYWLTVLAVESGEHVPRTNPTANRSDVISTELDGPMRTIAEVFVQVRRDLFCLVLFHLEISRSNAFDFCIVAR